MRRVALASIVVVGLLAGQAQGQTFDYAFVDVPCNPGAPTFCPGAVAVQTIVSGINAAGDLVGSFVDGAKRQHGFVRHLDSYTTIDVPGEWAGVTGTLPTSANGINAAGEIVGSYALPVNVAVRPDSPAYCSAAFPAACVKGFLYRQGTFFPVLFPGHPGAVPQRIMPNGDIYGCLHDNDLGMSMYGAVWTRAGDRTLMANGGELADPTVDKPMSMNNGATPGGQIIVGLWMDTRRHGFVVQNGQFQSYDVPSRTIKVTVIWDINPRGEFVGTYVDATGRHGFLQEPDGSLPIQLDVTGQTDTIAYGINTYGVIVGTYAVGGLAHGFVATPLVPRRR